MQEVLLTPNGYRILQDKIHKLIHIDMQKNNEELDHSIKEGNLKENPSYMRAMHQKEVLEKKLKVLRDKLHNSMVIDNAGYKGLDICLGAEVLIKDITSEQEFTYKLVCDEEVNISERLISLHSPLGEALYKSHVGDEIEVETPKGDKSYLILEVKY